MYGMVVWYPIFVLLHHTATLWKRFLGPSWSTRGLTTEFDLSLVRWCCKLYRKRIDIEEIVEHATVEKLRAESGKCFILVDNGKLSAVAHQARYIKNLTFPASILELLRRSSSLSILLYVEPKNQVIPIWKKRRRPSFSRPCNLCCNSCGILENISRMLFPQMMRTELPQKQVLGNQCYLQNLTTFFKLLYFDNFCEMQRNNNFIVSRLEKSSSKPDKELVVQIFQGSLEVLLRNCTYVQIYLCWTNFQKVNFQMLYL